MAYLDPEGLAALIRRLGHLGATARWISRFVPVMTPEADPRTCTRSFAHLMPGKRQTLRGAYATLLKERTARNAPPVPIPRPRVAYLASEIPIGAGGCLFCGVGHQSVSAVTVAREGRENVARDVWTPKRGAGDRTAARQRLSPDQLSGVPLPGLSVPTLWACACHRTDRPRMGPGGRARTREGGVPAYGDLAVDGLVGSGDSGAQGRAGRSRGARDPRPGTRPWQHLGDLEALSEQLGVALG